MVGTLNLKMIDQILYTGMLGRLGCHLEGRTYIVPINYVYDGECIYGHSLDGMKLHMMRLNPEVCFEVEQIKNASNWQCVIAWGTFEELQGDATTNAVRLLVQRLMTLIAGGQSLHQMEMPDEHGMDAAHPMISVYRIRLTEKTGRFESETM